MRRSRFGDPSKVEIMTPDGRERARAQLADPELFNRTVAEGQIVTTWVARLRGKELDLQAHLFTPATLADDVFAIGVTDHSAERIRSELRDPRAAFDAVRDWLRDEFSLAGLAGDHRRRIVHTGSPDGAGPDELRGFTLLGPRWAADVGLRDDRYQITHLTAVSHRLNERPQQMSGVNLRFVDASVQEKTSERHRASIAGLFEVRKSYIELWSEYNRLEREALIEEALQLGVPAYERWQTTSEGNWSFQLVPEARSAAFLRALEQRRRKPELEVAPKPPPELVSGGAAGRSVAGTVKRVLPDEWTVELKPTGRQDAFSREPATIGYVFLALSGDRTIRERRDRARDRISTNNAEMRDLARLIEVFGTFTEEQRPFGQYKKHLRQAELESFKGAGPTHSQTKALELALRTPDILLVQGPPGTGKTKFITTLLRCLDLAGESSRAFNRTLITSFQSEAVDNMVGKARYQGMPPSRIDRDRVKSRKTVELMRQDIKRSAAQRHAEIPQLESRKRLNELTRLVIGYDECPTTAAGLIELLDRIEDLAGDDLPLSCRHRLTELQDQIRSRTAPSRVLLAKEHTQAMRTLRSLRDEPVSFADDGPDRARRALECFGRLGFLEDTEIEQTLRRAATSDHAADPEIPAALALLKTRMLEAIGGDSLIMAPIRARDDEIQTLLHDILDAAEAEQSRRPGDIGQALADYLEELDGNIDLIQDILNGYNSVLASTVQQTDAPAMHLVLDAPVPVFGSVIVDEAARANPLDLMIPMACGKDRIILVGDHKQLPHALERKLERELRRTGRFADTSLLQQSLFQRWFNEFAERSRIRTITLDMQFRMHPILGRFVSETFYGGPEVIQSHPSTHHLTHRLEPYAGKVAAWIDVPYAAGSVVRQEHSFARPIEAERLAAELRRLVDQDAGKQLSFGVITFYSDQIEEIWNELIMVGLAIPDENGGGGRPARHMVWTDEPEPRERLRVGSIDAFQGMEFDIVMLSVVRSDAAGAEERRQPTLSRYGHLTSEQRLCVALSRQRRLLLAVGDAAMFARETAPSGPDRSLRSPIEGLVAFQELCKGPNGAGIRS
jgi:hypothetical protein